MTQLDANALDAEAEEFARDFASMVSNIERVLRGKTQVIRLALACLAAEGHLLIEDVPGIGKTSLAKAIAESIDGTWTRIQFTPDLLPTDVTGVQIFNRRTALASCCCLGEGVAAK